MKRTIRHIIVHAVERSEAKKLLNKNFHYCINPYGTMQTGCPCWCATDNIPAVDAQAIHIHYIIDRSHLTRGLLLGSPEQQERLFDKILALTGTYRNATISNATDYEERLYGQKDFEVKQWLSTYLPRVLEDDLDVTTGKQTV
jgi:hypothetical protein